MAETNENDPTRAAFGQWLDLWKPLIEKLQTFRWEGDNIEQILNFTRRAVIVRQFEALQAVETLIKGGHGNFGVVLIRAAFEELVWVEYFSKIPEHAKGLIFLLMQHELTANLQAQNDYAGAIAMLKGGFTQKAVREAVEKGREGRTKIREIGRILGWDTRTLLPSMLYLSKAVGRERELQLPLSSHIALCTFLDTGNRSASMGKTRIG